MNQTVFIIDTYSRFAPQDVQDMVRYKFFLNDAWYAIIEAPLEWGIIQMTRPIGEERLPPFHYFNTYDEALAFVKELKHINDGL